MQFKIILFLLLMMAAISGTAISYYKRAEILYSQQVEIITSLQKTIEDKNLRYKTQIKNTMLLADKNTKLLEEIVLLTDKFLDHNLEELSRKKPAMIERRINDGTKDLFDSFRSLSAQ